MGIARARRATVSVMLAVGLILTGCGSSTDDTVGQKAAVATSEPPVTHASASEAAGEPDPRADAAAAPSTSADHAGVRIAFAGDVNFSERTADRLSADPATAFGAAAPGLAAADLTIVNLETAITGGGAPEPKSFTFRAPPSALTALEQAGIDVASMANNHAADYGPAGIQDSLTAIEGSGFPVIGFGATDVQALAPYQATVKGVHLAVFGASAVHDRTLQVWTASADSPGIASAFDPRLPAAITAAAAAGETVVVFLHWGTEYEGCPDGDQLQLADIFAEAGATAVIGAHAHVLQGAGWRSDGVYVAYGLSNYLWWRSFGNEQDDNGVLTLTIDGKRVVDAEFAPSHLDDTGVPVPATGEQAVRINEQWAQVRECADLAEAPPG